MATPMVYSPPGVAEHLSSEPPARRTTPFDPKERRFCDVSFHTFGVDGQMAFVLAALLPIHTLALAMPRDSRDLHAKTGKGGGKEERRAGVGGELEVLVWMGVGLPPLVHLAVHAQLLGSSLTSPLALLTGSVGTLDESQVRFRRCRRSVRRKSGEKRRVEEVGRGMQREAEKMVALGDELTVQRLALFLPRGK